MYRIPSKRFWDDYFEEGLTVTGSVIKNKGRTGHRLGNKSLKSHNFQLKPVVAWDSNTIHCALLLFLMFCHALHSRWGSRHYQITTNTKLQNLTDQAKLVEVKNLWKGTEDTIWGEKLEKKQTNGKWSEGWNSPEGVQCFPVRLVGFFKLQAWQYTVVLSLLLLPVL